MARTYIPGIGWVDARSPTIPKQQPKPPPPLRAPVRPPSPQQSFIPPPAPRPSAPIVPRIAPAPSPLPTTPIVTFTGAPMREATPLEPPVVAFTGAPMRELPAPRTRGELSISRESGAGLVIDPFGFSTTPERAEAALSTAPALALAPEPSRPGAPSVTRPTQFGTVGAGGTLDQQLLNLAATDPERLRERARFINMSRDRGAQIDVGVALTAEAMGRGQFPDVMTDAVASRLAELYGYESLEEMMADLGYIPNPDAPGTWLRREAVAPGTFGTSGFGTSGFGGGGVGGGQPTFIQGAVPRATRGGGFSLGLTNWRI